MNPPLSPLFQGRKQIRERFRFIYCINDFTSTDRIQHQLLTNITHGVIIARMYRIDYYTEPSGRQPVAEWLDYLNINASAHMHDKMVRLQQNGLMLLNTKMMRPIKGYGSDFYEVKFSRYRIALYHEKSSNTFVLLHGFKKTRRRESREIKTAYSRLREYQSRG